MIKVKYPIFPQSKDTVLLIWRVQVILLLVVGGQEDLRVLHRSQRGDLLVVHFSDRGF